MEFLFASALLKLVRMGIQARFPQLGLLLILLAGVYMTAAAWGWNTPWILVSLAAFVVIGALGGALIDPRLSAIQQVAEREETTESIPPVLQARIADPVLWTALQTATWLALGVVFLMTNKPDLLVSLLTVAGAVVLGVVVAQPWRRPRESSARAKEANPVRGEM